MKDELVRNSLALRSLSSGSEGDAFEFLTLSELCEWLKVKPATVYDWVHIGFIPHVKLGRLLRFERAVITAWLAERQRPGRSTKKLPLKQVSP